VIGGAALALLALAVVLLVGRRHHHGADKKRTTATTAELPRASAPKITPGFALPAWTARRDLDARRIAGHVTFDGAPFAGALVELSSGSADEVVLSTRSGADGAFDLGPQPVATYLVAASAPGKAPAIVPIDLAGKKKDPGALVLELGGCATSLFGVVSDSSGGPIPRARVSFMRLAGVEADDKGAYELCAGKRRSESVTAGADGYGTLQFYVQLKGRTRRDIRLAPEATVIGRVVVAATGEPVDGAIVSVQPGSYTGGEQGAAMRVVTDGAGRFRAGGLMPGGFVVRALADGMGTGPGKALQIALLAGQTAEVLLQLEPQSTISGRVVVAGTKTPVPDAQVIARSTAGRYLSFTTADDDGAFRLEHVARGPCKLETNSGLPVVAPAELAVDRPLVDGVVLEVKQMGSIYGFVTRHGAHVGNAQVDGHNSFTRADDDGAYRLQGLPAGTFKISATADDESAYTVQEVTLADGEQRQLDLELDGAGTIGGVVVDQDGQPVGGAYVRYEMKSTGDQGADVTADDGTFTCRAMTGGGDYAPRVFASADARSKPFELLEGGPLHLENGDADVEGVKRKIKRHLLALSGRVVDGTGAPVPDARVTVHAGDKSPPGGFWGASQSGLADASGAYSIGDLVDGTYQLTAKSPEGGVGTATAQAGATGVSITVPRVGAIDGQLTGFATIPGVYARSDDWDTHSATVDGTTFHIPNLPPGSYQVSASTDAEADQQKVTVAEGQTAHVVLTSHGQGRVEGSLVDFHTKAPLAGFECHDGPGFGSANATTGPDGRFVIDPSPAGDREISCYSPDMSSDWSGASADVTIERGGSATVALLAVARGKDRSDPGFRLDWQAQQVTVGEVTHASGLAAGDVIASVDGQSIAGLSDDGVMALIVGRPAGSTVTIATTNGKNVSVTTTEETN
jgi:protocatechuate 3,4-dioxygenase beta subunit